MTNYTHILDLAKEAEPPADGILSKTIYQDDRVKAVVFGFGQGQELSEHTAAKPAMLFFVKGEATVGLGEYVCIVAKLAGRGRMLVRSSQEDCKLTFRKPSVRFQRRTLWRS